MTKNTDFHKVTLNLRLGDWEYLHDAFRTRGYPTSVIVRNLVSRYVDALRQHSGETTVDPAELNLGRIDND